MVATADCEEAPKHVSGKKVSKPLMEKKRRARINKCLDQLKSLLENYYSTSIRKRKLEKADILELTVNHLRNLQKTQSCGPSDVCDYQRGFRRCLAHVDQYVMVTDAATLSQLSSRLGRSRSGGGAISTTDSGPGPAGAPHQQRRLHPKAHGGTEGPGVNALSHLPEEDTRSGSWRVHADACVRKADPGDADRSESTSAAHMWRPW